VIEEEPEEKGDVNEGDDQNEDDEEQYEQ